ncbi:hypothetical protein A3J90_05925 [candidate division WOR-1 bacterium RIFOXYC2_FULL_37_10]|uniref:YrhK domain-containing protein n=1 Tax=candidate division WOR-1 bacterium RIFOXYB2_FULL_37_13 TaxID=1802579 RepID=A0A1F4SQ15_UNCSA|nr:MAG: hypothetical protein A2246_05660 [candidate division WOR-1 bacterium RIFOXYA2_FULL_37_7]OGC22526.1 MAG: hypothetical protein A2310_07140 [candidate division WOR-1 bacterium RIFOXYB2_FULL_37_13]OGC34923.1 MAG: hypothetical protein A3J90_05925 [candidate division WOR-1 bacterium RIFOXYC2_FULL_37_10]
MKKFSNKQLDRISEIAGNIAVAWFSAGVISPLFIHSQSLLNFIFTFGMSIIMAISSFTVSLVLLEETNNA